MDQSDYALFPLSTVVFPGGIMPLRIFEPRYLDMVAMCMKGQTPFGVCAARPAQQGEFSEPHAVGTLVEIVDFDRLDDGQLGITVEGKRRFEVVATRQADNGLWWGTIDFIDETADSACPIEFAPLKQVAAALIQEIGLPYDERDPNYDSRELAIGASDRTPALRCRHQARPAGHQRPARAPAADPADDRDRERVVNHPGR